MSDEPRCINCKATLRWERGGGEWKPNTCDSNVAIRCLNCASLLCGPCARRHFEESGLLATSRAALAASQAEVSALKERLACETESGKRCVGELVTVAASLERARLALRFATPRTPTEEKT